MKWVKKVPSVRRSGSRDLTRSAVLALLGTRGAMSRADVARELGLSPAAVTPVVRRLLEQGMVTELAQAPSSGGRPGQLVGLVGSAGRALGVKVAADHLAIVEVRLDGQMITSGAEPFDAVSPDALTRLGEVLSARVAASDRDLPPLLGVGIGVPGIVRSPDQGVVDADVLGWRDVPVGRHLRGVLGLPVVVENDVNALGVAEVLYGHGREVRDFLVLTIGRGIGLTVIADGSVYRGALGGAGEFGHFPIEDDGPLCGCGRRGCLEARIGQDGLVAWARDLGVLGPRQSFRALTTAAESGSAPALALFADAGRLLGRTIAGIANVLDPDRVVVAGEGTLHWPLWDEGFRAEFARRQLRGDDQIAVVVDAWDDSAWAQGAAALVLAAPFDLDAGAGEQGDLVVARLHGDHLEPVR